MKAGGFWGKDNYSRYKKTLSVLAELFIYCKCVFSPSVPPHPRRPSVEHNFNTLHKIYPFPFARRTLVGTLIVWYSVRKHHKTASRIRKTNPSRLRTIYTIVCIRRFARG